MKILLLYSLSFVALIVADPTTSHASEMGDYLSKDRFQVRLRALGVIPQDDSFLNIAGDADVENSFTPEVDLTYFLTQNIAAELIAATAQHDLTYTGDVDLGSTWILPPTLTLQYHFTPESKFSPYLGAGLNYSMFYGEDTGTGFNNLDVDGGMGVAAQAGFDYWLNDNWGINFDVKKLWLNIDATLNNGAIRADVDLDPVLLGAGVSYRF